MRSAAELPRARTQLARRLKERRAEIEQALFARIGSIEDPRGGSDPEYAEGLRASIGGALDYGLAAIGRGENGAPPTPAILLTQARLAARYGIGLQVVLRRYFAGFALLGDFLVEEAAETSDLSGTSLKRLLASQSALFDRLIANVSEEYAKERARHPGSSKERLARSVERLLGGELVDTSQIAYDLHASHLALLAVGRNAGEIIRELAAALDRRALIVPRGDATVWAWLGGRRDADPEQAKGLLAEEDLQGTSVSLGEPGRGVAGWRRSHRQASAALPIAMRGPDAIARYADVALIASVLKDDLLSASLRELYLEPLGEDSELRETLRAYFAAGRNVTAAAAALGISRQAAAKRLRAAERRFGRGLSERGLEIELALRLEGSGGLSG